jgi:glycosyltransferase involved in cell wall biosynthesis
LSRPVALLLGPARQAISGETTHVNLLLGSPLGEAFDLRHFQVGASPFRLLAEIVRGDAAIVHVNTSLNRGAYWRDLMYVAAAKLCGAKVVYQVHGGALPGDFFQGSFLSNALKKTLRWPDAVIVLSSDEYKAYTDFVPGQAVAKLPSGIDCRPFLKYNRQLPDAKAPLKLAYVGRLAREKGLFETLEALRLARFRGVEARLVIAGSGPEEPRLKARVRDLGLGREVGFAGPVEGERKAKLLAQADVLMLPSHAEGLPYALLEGMAAGAVPIATRVGAIPDVMSDGVHGVFVPARDPEAIVVAISGLAADRAKLARMSAASRKRISSAFSIERLACDLGALYSGLLAQRSPKTVL